jgi:hypothetical protein
MALIGYGIIYELPDEGFPFDRIIEQISDPEERDDAAQEIIDNDSKFDENLFQELLTQVTSEADIDVWIGDAGPTDTFYIILQSASESVHDSGPVSVNLDKLQPGSEKDSFDGLIGQIFPGISPSVFLINDCE